MNPPRVCAMRSRRRWRRALQSAGLAPETHFASIVAGVSGYEGRIFGQAPDLRATRFVMMHDAPVAHAGALGGEPGVVVIAGTGSVVYGTDALRGRTIGGWGYLFGDEGSAFWLVREALAIMMHAEDDVETSQPLEAARGLRVLQPAVAASRGARLLQRRDRARPACILRAARAQARTRFARSSSAARDVLRNSSEMRSKPARTPPWRASAACSKTPPSSRGSTTASRRSSRPVAIVKPRGEPAMRRAPAGLSRGGPRRPRSTR